MKNNVSPSDLSIFLAVLSEGGFRAAAGRLNVAPSKVSTTISRIEAQLGVPLLLRTTRSVMATEQGQALAERVAPLLSEVNAAVMETANSRDVVRGRLKLNVPGAVMPDILPPLVVDFQRRHPLVEVEIVVENDLVDIIAAGCDAGIRYGARLEKDMISIPLGPRIQWVALAASPGYLAEREHPQTPADLLLHDAIRYRLLNGRLLPWVLKDGDKTVEVDAVTRLTLSVNALNTGLSYARSGLGIIGAFRNWLESDFASGTLVPILQNYWPAQNGPRLYYPSRYASTPLRAFIETCKNSARHK
ncbi:LysR family transcriptional regulator [uncultured Roseibium sp.]|uniref:LysR family transcriptional regulator n=1 Tax=uncultured Roseibium sp. TaxID=1936171 RepID=UPI0032168077